MMEWMAVGFAFVTLWCWFLRLKLHAFLSHCFFLLYVSSKDHSHFRHCFLFPIWMYVKVTLKLWHHLSTKFCSLSNFLFLNSVTVNFSGVRVMSCEYIYIHTHTHSHSLTFKFTLSLIQHLWVFVFFYWLSLLTFERCFIFLISILFIKLFQLYNTVYSCALVSIKLAFMNLGSRIFY